MRFIADQATLHCRFAFSADFVPQMVLHLIDGKWYWKKTMVMEIMMDE